MAGDAVERGAGSALGVLRAVTVDAPSHCQRSRGRPQPGDAQEDRLNESLSRADLRMVDRIDPQRRPLFVRTPSGRVLRYGEGRLAVVTRAPAKLAQRGFEP